MKAKLYTTKQQNITKICFLGIAYAVLTAFSQLNAATITGTFYTEADTKIVKLSSNYEDVYKNYGGSLSVGGDIRKNNVDGAGQYSFLRFDLSSIPNDSVITSVTLKLTGSTSAYNYSGQDAKLIVYQVDSENSGWVEGTGTAIDPNKGVTARYLNQTSYTSTTAHDGDSWKSGGVFDPSEDLASEIGSLGFASLVIDTTYSISLDPLAIQAWLSDPNLENAGIALQFTNNEGYASGTNRFIYFYSSNTDVDAIYKPHLEITYELIPEPSIIGFLGLAGLLCLVRRKRCNA